MTKAPCQEINCQGKRDRVYGAMTFISKANSSVLLENGQRGIDR